MEISKNIKSRENKLQNGDILIVSKNRLVNLVKNIDNTTKIILENSQ